MIPGVLNQFTEIDALIKRFLSPSRLLILGSTSMLCSDLRLAQRLGQPKYSIKPVHALPFADANLIPYRDDIDRDLESSLTLHEQTT
jgi:hypothetical protein